jgi:anti-sigma B factor antagonist
MAMLRFRRRRSSPAGARLMSGPDDSVAHESRPPDPASPAQGGRVTIEVETGPGVTTIVVKGELDLVTTPYLATRLTLVLRDRPGRLVFDLSGTHFMDCGSARLIAAAGQRLPGGGRPVIRRPRPGVRRVLELTGLDAHCEIEP